MFIQNILSPQSFIFVYKPNRKFKETNVIRKWFFIWSLTWSWAHFSVQKVIFVFISVLCFILFQFNYENIMTFHSAFTLRRIAFSRVFVQTEASGSSSGQNNLVKNLFSKNQTNIEFPTKNKTISAACNYSLWLISLIIQRLAFPNF